MNRARLPQLNSVSSSFEPIKKNPISLADDSFLDEHQKPIRIGGSASPLSLSSSKIRIDGDFHLEGKLANPLLQTEFEYLELRAEENIRFTSANSSGSLDLYVVGGDSYFLTSSGDFSFTTTSTGGINFGTLGVSAMFKFDTLNTKFIMSDPDDDGDNFSITVDTHGATAFATVDDDAAAAHMTLDPDGDLIFSGCDVKIDDTKKLYFDSGSVAVEHTYIYESSDDVLRIAVGGDTIVQLSEKGDDGNEVHFGSSCAGFTQLEPTYNSSSTVVDFRHSNKQNLTFGAGSITNVQLYFPTVSGNFQLLIKQDGTGSRTITNYKVYEFDESTADGSAAAVFAGGSNPTLTTDANHVDILSFYWDADNEIAYGVATLDFQF